MEKFFVYRGDFLEASRGEVIITQKEAKGEYGSDFTWKRDSTIYGNQEVEPHVIDGYSVDNNSPRRMTNFGKTSSHCEGDIATTSGDILPGGNRVVGQISCNPNTGNVGNYYDWSAAVATNFVELNEWYNTRDFGVEDSICPYGWMLPSASNSKVDKSFAELTSYYASGQTDEESIRTGATSFVRSGAYNYNDSTPSLRGTTGGFWSNLAYSSTFARYLYFDNASFTVSHASNKGYGLSVRCVAR